MEEIMIEIRIRYKDRSENVINFAERMEDEQLEEVFNLLQKLLGNSFKATHPRKIDYSINTIRRWPYKKLSIWKSIVIAQLTDTEIVDIFGVTRQYVSLIRKEMKESLNDT